MKTRSGFTLIEVLLATAIMGAGLLVILSSLGPPLAMIGASKQYQEVQWVFGLAQLKHPMTEFENLEDIVVEDDEELAEEEDTLGEGYVFSRDIDEKTIEDEKFDDGLYIVRSRVRWGEGDAFEEIVQLVWKKGGGPYPP